MNYYNENDPKTAAWLRELINQKLIPEGYVDSRSILDVCPNDLKDFTQCHFFAGIGGWSYALQLAGWPADKPVWTGSCPCQPFSKAGKGEGITDERHLWPAFKWLIQQCKPSIVFGEQVASELGCEWLAGVRVDLEEQTYEVGAADLCAASKLAPHVRQRLFWFAHTNSQFDLGSELSTSRWASEIPSVWQSSQILEKGQRGVDELVSRRFTQRVSSYSEARSLLHGIPARMEQMRGAGNAIVPQVAAEFIKASVESIQDYQNRDWI